MGEEFRIELVDKEKIDDLLIVYRAAFDSTADYEKTKEYWKKKHYTNPVHDSYVFGAYDGDKLVSMNAYMPMKYKIDERNVSVIQSCESGTLPDYRGKGLWSKVVTYAINYFKQSGEYDFLMGFPNYENSYGGFIKMKWNHDTDIINYIMVGNGQGFVKALVGKKIPFTRVFEVQRIRLSKRVRCKYSIMPEAEEMPLENQEGFNVELSKEFIEWKQNYKKLEYFFIKSNITNKHGICYYSLDYYKGERIALLYRLDAPYGNSIIEFYSIAIQEILKRHKEIAFIRTWVMPKSDNEQVAKELGFIKSKHHNPFITYTLKEDVISEDLLRNECNWKNLSFMDLD